MTTLDRKAIKAASRKITGGSTFDADERIGIAIDVVRTYLVKASPALSSLPAQAVGVKLVPVEKLTAEMRAAAETAARKINPGRSEDHIKSVALDGLSIYRAIVAAAP